MILGDVSVALVVGVPVVVALFSKRINKTKRQKGTSSLHCECGVVCCVLAFFCQAPCPCRFAPWGQGVVVVRVGGLGGVRVEVGTCESERRGKSTKSKRKAAVGLAVFFF